MGNTPPQNNTNKSTSRWDCNRCTFLNDSDLSHCKICGTARPNRKGAGYFKKKEEIKVSANGNMGSGLQQIVAMGFDEDTSRSAMSLSGNNTQNAIHHLLSTYSMHLNVDTNNMLKLNEFAVQHENKRFEFTDVASSHLLSVSNSLGSKQCDHILAECDAIRRIRGILSRYTTYISSNDKDDGWLCGYYDNTDLLNDFNHLIFYHSEQFEDIYNILINKVYKKNACNVSECSMMRRNHRKRSDCDNTQVLSEIYFNNDCIVEQQLIDRIHCHYMHTFDIGYKLSANEKELIRRNGYRYKSNFAHNIDKNYIASQVNTILAQKTKLCNIMRHSKLVTEEKRCLDLYDYGFRFFYWDHYKNNQGICDEANNTYSFYLGENNKGCANLGFTLAQWYIDKKYMNLKEELLCNVVCRIAEIDWRILLQKAFSHLRTEYVKEIFCPRKQSAKCYEMYYGKQMDAHHIITMMCYTNYNLLQMKFSDTFRRQTPQETDSELKNRHSNFYFMGRYLRECVEGFGCTHVSSKSLLRVYRGVSKSFTFSSMNATINCPFSTTTEYAVARSFCNNTGMVLEFSINRHSAVMDLLNSNRDAFFRMNLFDAQWFSDFPHEQEIFCIGGLIELRFTTIITEIGQDFGVYIKAIKQLTLGMSDQILDIRDLTDSSLLISNKFEKKLIYMMLSHELYRYMPKHENAHKFKGCPRYAKDILHLHCKNIKVINIFNVKNSSLDFFKMKEYGMHGCIKLGLLVTVFPNVEGICCHFGNKDISYVSNLLLSILTFIADKKSTNSLLRIVEIFLDPKYEKEVVKCLQTYKLNFMAHGWWMEGCMMEDELTKTGINLPIMMDEICGEGGVLDTEAGREVVKKIQSGTMSALGRPNACLIKGYKRLKLCVADVAAHGKTFEDIAKILQNQ
eukprot:521843_1